MLNVIKLIYFKKQIFPCLELQQTVSAQSNHIHCAHTVCAVDTQFREETSRPLHLCYKSNSVAKLLFYIFHSKFVRLKSIIVLASLFQFSDAR